MGVSNHKYCIQILSRFDAKRLNTPWPKWFDIGATTNPRQTNILCINFTKFECTVLLLIIICWLGFLVLNVVSRVCDSTPNLLKIKLFVKVPSKLNLCESF